MTDEKQNIEYKSLQKIRTGDKGFRALAETCVALANAQGGQIYIGFDDKQKKPLPNQVIEQKELNEAVTKLRSLCFNVAMAASEIMTDESGSQYFIVTVSPSLKTIATTSDGKIYIRIADKCEPIRSEDLQRLGEEKGTYQWEIVKTRIPVTDIHRKNLSTIADDIRNSRRARLHIQQMDDIELAEYYHLIDEGVLTHLGVLWLGTTKERGNLSYPITVQYIVYDELENKVRKEEWHDNMLNPKELLLDIERKAIELTYSFEFPNGLFRKTIRRYHKDVVRELLINAFAHKSYTISNDIMIEVHPDRLEISSPGGLPFGVTKDNILHARHRRNPHLIDLFYVLELMEGEGSGYDLIYELNAKEAKMQPQLYSSFNEVRVVQSANIVNTELLPLLDYLLANYTFSQKGWIALGIIAREGKILSTQLASILQLTEEDRLRSYIGKLIKDNIICRSGVKKGSALYVNPQLIKNSKSNIKTSLKTIEPYALKALIIEDLRLHPKSSISQITKRLPDVELREVRNMVYSMIGQELTYEGERRYRVYMLK